MIWQKGTIVSGAPGGRVNVDAGGADDMRFLSPKFVLNDGSDYGIVGYGLDLVDSEVPAITNGTMSIVGDSFPGLNSLAAENRWTVYNSGYSAMLEVISNGKFLFEPALNHGVAGRRSDEVLAAFDSEVTAADAVAGLGVVDVGRNDVTQYPTLSTAQSIANIKAICAKYLALNKPVLLFLPNPPRADSTLSATPATRTIQRQMMVDVNAAIRAYALGAANGVYLVDYETEWGGAGNAPTANFTYDGLHPTRIGSYWAAKTALDTHGALFLARTLPSNLVYNAATQPFGNLLGLSPMKANGLNMAGADGQKFNAVGSLATAFCFGRDSGSSVDADITLSKEGPDGGGLSKQLYALAMAGNFVGEFLGTNTFGSRPVIPAELLGKQIRYEITLEVTSNKGGAGAKFDGLAPQIVAYNNGAAVLSSSFGGLDSLAAGVFELPVGTYLLRSPPVTVSAVDASPIFWAATRANIATGVTAGFKLSKPWIGRVT